VVMVARVVIALGRQQDRKTREGGGPFLLCLWTEAAAQWRGLRLDVNLDPGSSGGGAVVRAARLVEVMLIIGPSHDSLGF
jgi:hypothetical protein